VIPPKEDPIDLSSPALGAIRRTSAVDTVRARIALAVELGLVLPGERLPLPEVTATAFGVSEVTVRRGYRSLQDDGILVRRRGNAGGTFVAESPSRSAMPAKDEYLADVDHVNTLIDQRALVESSAARLAALARSSDDIENLSSLVGRMRVVTDWAEYREADVAFHARLVKAAMLPAAVELHHRVSTELYAYFLPYPLDYLRRSNEEHAQLVNALDAGDAGASAELAFAHVMELHHSMYVGFLHLT
jgi:GntR family transcriptional repressor for pyruvate dehydrogenase complex